MATTRTIRRIRTITQVETEEVHQTQREDGRWADIKEDTEVVDIEEQDAQLIQVLAQNGDGTFSDTEDEDAWSGVES